MVRTRAAAHAEAALLGGEQAPEARAVTKAAAGGTEAASNAGAAPQAVQGRGKSRGRQGTGKKEVTAREPASEPEEEASTDTEPAPAGTKRRRKEVVVPEPPMLCFCAPGPPQQPAIRVGTSGYRQVEAPRFAASGAPPPLAYLPALSLAVAVTSTGVPASMRGCRRVWSLSATPSSLTWCAALVPASSLAAWTSCCASFVVPSPKHNLLSAQVELNATFYGWFDEGVYDSWRDRCSAGLRLLLPVAAPPLPPAVEQAQPSLLNASPAHPACIPPACFSAAAGPRRCGPASNTPSRRHSYTPTASASSPTKCSPTAGHASGWVEATPGSFAGCGFRRSHSERCACHLTPAFPPVPALRHAASGCAHTWAPSSSSCPPPSRPPAARATRQPATSTGCGAWARCASSPASSWLSCTITRTTHHAWELPCPGPCPTAPHACCRCFRLERSLCLSSGTPAGTARRCTRC